MVKKILCLIFMLLFSINGIFAVVNVNITGKVIEYGHYSEEIVFTHSCQDVIYFTFPKGARNIRYENNTQILDNQNFSISGCNNKTKIIYSLDIIETIGDEERIERKFLSLSGLNYTYSLEMPIYFKLNENETTPKDYDIKYFDNSKLIIFPKNEVYLIYYVPAEPEINEISIGKFIEEIKEPVVIIYIIVFFVLGFFISYIIYRKHTSKILLEHVPSYVLSKEEKSLLDVIEKNPGINQKLIGKELDYSKARVSAFVNDLEQKGLIRRERFGRTFKVYLNKKIV